MNTIEKAVRQLVVVMYYIAGGAIVLMMLLTCADVLLRYATTLYAKFGWKILASVKPIPGTYELVCLLAVVAAALAMAHTSWQAGHVSVNFVVRLFSEKVQAVFQVITGSIGTLFFAILGWQSVVYAEKSRALGEVSMTLQFPFYPFVYCLAFSSFTVCLVLIILGVGQWLRVGKK